MNRRNYSDSPPKRTTTKGHMVTDQKTARLRRHFPTIYAGAAITAHQTRVSLLQSVSQAKTRKSGVREAISTIQAGKPALLSIPMAGIVRRSSLQRPGGPVVSRRSLLAGAQPRRARLRSRQSATGSNAGRNVRERRLE